MSFSASYFRTVIVQCLVKLPLSIIIPTYNEAENIAALLQQLTWADEIIVVDSFSTDDTPVIVQNTTATLLQRVYQGPADQKNWAIRQAKHQWVLILDADERLTPLLTQEIKEIVNRPTIKYAGYYLYRQNYFMGKKINYSGLQRDRVIRLIQRDLCAYNNKQVHEEIETEGKIGYLNHKLEHFTYKNLAHFLAKNERYGLWSAQDHFLKVPQVTFYHLWFKPLGRFLNQYLFKKGFLDGQAGFIFCVIMAWGVFLRYVKIKEMRQEGYQK
ncbi:glycosyltransferase family 2 protein [Aureispira anguillae]|uniref:Glycosyltransferase family 2 protein n=1 Tax=Aureispira anguillae TaxID=2864201 RepID=A0A915YJF5_9BACT|nr:glycosyltransferase family 2 protein [Aureispira anguillae]BDS14134.1 glycosyltransferase family 2 protein [Aureispira anguillae]